MGKLRSGIISDIRGKIGDIIYMGNRKGSIVFRDYVAPTDPSSTYQGYARTAWSDLHSAWEGFTSAQRSLWAETAQMYLAPYRPLRGKVPSTGRDWFFRKNFHQRYLFRYGLNILNSIAGDPPTYWLGRPTPGDFIVAPAANPDRLEFSIFNHLPVPIRIAAQRSAPLNTSVNRFYGPWDASTWTAANTGVAAASSGDRYFSGLFPSAGKYAVRLFVFTGNLPLGTFRIQLLSGPFQTFIFTR